jgi:hypothetical protein
MSSPNSCDAVCRDRRHHWWVRILERILGSDSGELRGLVELAADGRGRRWTRQLQRDRQAGLCVGSLDRGELDFGVVPRVRQRRRQHLVHRCAQREHRFSRRRHHRQRATDARQAGSGRICAANANADATYTTVTDAVTNATVTNATVTNTAVTGATVTGAAVTNTVTNTAVTCVHLLDCALHPERWRRRNDGNCHRDRRRRL